MKISKLQNWIKSTKEGKLYVDTSNPEWNKRIIQQIKKCIEVTVKKANISKPDNDE